MLLSDKAFNKTKKAIIERQPADFIPLTGVMSGALAKLVEVHNELMSFDINADVKDVAETVFAVITEIKETGHQNWYFYDEDGPELVATDKDGQSIEFIKAQYVTEFPWKEYEEMIFKFAL